MNLTVYNNNKEALFTGTKQDCMNYIKLNRLSRTQVAIKQAQNIVPTPDPTPYETTTYVEPKPKGFFKRIFKPNT